MNNDPKKSDKKPNTLNPARKPEELKENQKSQPSRPMPEKQTPKPSMPNEPIHK